MPEETSYIPKHVAVIMDGNGRWASERGLPRVAGHRAGVKTVREIVKASIDFGVPILTLYAFSQENWKRPKEEVTVLMKLLDFFLDKELKNLIRQGVQFRTLGRIEGLPLGVQQKLKEAVEKTKKNDKLTLNIALNYGARTEILDAVREILKDAPTELTEDYFSSHLYTQGLPDPDLLIRTSGEMRLSNFLLWQRSYAEFYVTKKYWPDFTREDYLKALREYQKRERRFGDIHASH